MKRISFILLLLTSVSVQSQTLPAEFDVAGWHVWITPVTPSNTNFPAQVDTLRDSTLLELAWDQPYNRTTPPDTFDLGLDYANSRVRFIDIDMVTLGIVNDSTASVGPVQEEIYFSEGRYCIQIDAQDHAGNISILSNPYWFYMDSNPPVPVRFRVLIIGQ